MIKNSKTLREWIQVYNAYNQYPEQDPDLKGYGDIREGRILHSGKLRHNSGISVRDNRKGEQLLPAQINFTK